MMLNDQLNDFGRRIGLPGLAMNDAGIAALAVSGVGELTLELAPDGSPAQGDLLFALALEAHPGTDASLLLTRALERVHWRTAPAMNCAAALVRGRLVLALRFDAERVTGAELENGLRLLLDEAARLGRA